ncbi:MAG: hypothetical protein NVSMB42_26350 [Herpetosiphon sp.]
MPARHLAAHLLAAVIVCSLAACSGAISDRPAGSQVAATSTAISANNVGSNSTATIPPTVVATRSPVATALLVSSTTGAATLTAIVPPGAAVATASTTGGPTADDVLACTNAHDANDTPLQPNDAKAELDKIIYHLNEANHAMNANEVTIARSQFKQYFTSWDRVDEFVQKFAPEQCVRIDLNNKTVERSLLRSPQDLNVARQAMHTLRDAFIDLSHQLEAR